MSNYNSTDCTSCEAEAGASSFNFSMIWICIISPSAILLNLIAMVTFLRVKDLLPNSTRMLMIHQAYIELWISSLGIVQQAVSGVAIHFPTTDYGFGLCLTFFTAYWAFDACLQLNCVLITVDRYFAVCHVMKKYFTRRRVLCLIVLVQCIGWLQIYGENVAIMRMDPVTGICYTISDSQVTRPWGAMYIAYLAAPIICVVVIYPQMIYTLVRSSKVLHNQSGQGDRTKSLAAKRLLRTGLVAAVVLIVSNTPDMVSFCIMYGILGHDINLMSSWEQTLNFLFKSLYPLMCPIMYSFSTSRFRSAVLTAFKIR